MQVIPRSLLLVTLESVDYLLCALGDGYKSTNTDAEASAKVQILMLKLEVDR
jgi:hypothetical protein